ncbi:MAG: phenylalanine--tRNA ligase subunit beta, partial [Alistipes sp.]|nr:phenylalanine--tRNA ligase subunit beta [Alistipes sp.]
VYALKRAALLMKEFAGGKISSEIIDINPTPAADFEFEMSLDRVNSLIGKQIPEETVRTILDALEVKILSEDGRILKVAVPPYRVDVQREADLVEDILRIYGYNNVEIPQAVHSTLSYAPKPDKNKLVNIAADHLAACGYTEIMSNSLTKASYYESLTSYKAENSVRIMNPLSADLNVMRQTLLFNVLEAVELNVNHRNADLRLFELGNCYYFNPEVEGEENPLARYSEKYRIAIAVTGLDAQPSWNVKAAGASFFTLRATVEKLLRRFGIDIYTLRSEPSQSDLYSDGIVYMQGTKPVIELGVVAPALLQKFDLKQAVYFAEIDFELITRAAKKQKIAVEELSKFPEVKRDLALLVDKSVTFAQLRNVAMAAEKKLLKRITLFDVYEGDKLPEGKKSYAFGFTLEDKTQTLNDKVIEKTMSNIARQLEAKAGAQIRS